MINIFSTAYYDRVSNSSWGAAYPCLGLVQITQHNYIEICMCAFMKRYAES